jgi:hypothetical protein
MIWLLPHPLHPSPVSLPKRRLCTCTLVTGVGKEPVHMMVRKPGPL